MNKDLNLEIPIERMQLLLSYIFLARQMRRCAKVAYEGLHVAKMEEKAQDKGHHMSRDHIHDQHSAVDRLLKIKDQVSLQASLLNNKQRSTLAPKLCLQKVVK